MAATYEPIASTTLGSGVSTYTFNSIPGTFTDLVLVISSHSTSTGGSVQALRQRYNGDTASNYSNTRLTGSGSVAASARRSNEVLMTGPVHGDNSAPFTTHVFHFMSYANTNVHKTVLMSTAAPDIEVGRYVGLWRSTSAITSIEVYDNAANFATGTTLALYGIKAA